MVRRRIALITILSILLLAPAVSSALGLVPIVPSDCNQAGGCSSICDLAQLAQNALDDGIYIAIFLSAVLFAWAGWNLVVGSSSGNPTQVTQARHIFKYVIIGLVVILSAWLIVSVIMSALTSNSNWNALCSS